MILGPKIRKDRTKEKEKERKPSRSNVVLIEGLLTEDLLEGSQEELRELEEDIRDKAKLYGTVVSCLIPREQEGFPKRICGNVALLR